MDILQHVLNNGGILAIVLSTVSTVDTYQFIYRREYKFMKNIITKILILTCMTVFLAACSDDQGKMKALTELKKAEIELMTVNKMGAPVYTKNLYKNASSIYTSAARLVDDEKYADAHLKLKDFNNVIQEIKTEIANAKRQEANALAAQSTTQVYYVVKGDSLWKIAKKALGNPFKWMAIYNLNKDLIKNPDLIFPGQQFKIPQK